MPTPAPCCWPPSANRKTHGTPHRPNARSRPQVACAGQCAIMKKKSQHEPPPQEHAMKMRTLGQGLTVSAEGLGCMGMSDAYGAADETEDIDTRSEEHTSELQSRQYLVCRLLL